MNYTAHNETKGPFYMSHDMTEEQGVGQFSPRPDHPKHRIYITTKLIIDPTMRGEIKILEFEGTSSF